MQFNMPTTTSVKSLPTINASRTLALITLLCAALSANAASFQGIVSHVWGAQGKIYLIVDNGAFDGSPGSCPASANSMQYVMDPATPFGRALISIAMTAKVTGRLIYVAGDGNCAGWAGGTAEGIVHMDFKG
jgi:hypothetical protein